jgi:hypothetical protein
VFAQLNRRESIIKYLLPVLGWYVLLCFYFIRVPFFNDTILFSRIAHWFYDNNFQSFILPENLDTGNQPFFCAYIALLWKVFGKSLEVSHLAMFPFVIGIVIQYYKLALRFVKPDLLPYAMLLLVVEPTLMAQSTQVIIDIPLVFFYLTGVNAILNNKRILLLLVIFGLGLTNLRGIMGIGWLVCTDVLINCKIIKQSLSCFLILLSTYIPAGILTLLWFIYHHSQVGWVLIQPNEWHGHRELQSLTGIIKNACVVIWRFFDYGKVVLWLFLSIGLFINYKKKINLSANDKLLLIIILTPLFGWVICFVPFSNPIGHRYFMLINLLLLLPVAQQFNHLKTRAVKIGVMLLFVIFIGLAQLLPYPERFANGWDSTITYTRYFKARDEMRDYIISQNINQKEIATGFPSNAAYEFSNLDNSTVEYANKYFGGINAYKYVIKSNINNDFKNNEIEDLHQHWVLVKEFSSFPVYIKLYKKP